MNIAFWTFLLTAVAFGPSTHEIPSDVGTTVAQVSPVASSTVATAIRFAR